MPTPNKGESKEDFVKRYMSSKEAIKTYPDEKKRYAVAVSVYKKSNQSSDWHLLEFSVPITEFGDAQIKEGLNEFKIRGVAISETTTSNGHKFLGEELKLSANTLRGVPLLKDHNNSVDSIVGRVMEAGYNEDKKHIQFEAKIMDQKMRELVSDGRLNTVSVGAIVRDLEESDGSVIPRGITFKELSLVAVPADSNASFNVALMEAYKKKKEEPKNNETEEEDEEDEAEEKSQSNKSEITLKGGLNMTEQTEKIEVKEMPKEVIKEVIKEVKVEDTAKVTKLEAELNEMKKLLEAQKAEIADKAEKAEVQEDAKFSIIQSNEGLRGRSISVVMKKYK